MLKQVSPRGGRLLSRREMSDRVETSVWQKYRGRLLDRTLHHSAASSALASHSCRWDAGSGKQAMCKRVEGDPASTGSETTFSMLSFKDERSQVVGFKVPESKASSAFQSWPPDDLSHIKHRIRQSTLRQYHRGDLQFPIFCCTLESF